MLNFFIFNSNYGNREDEESKKVIFFYPKNTDYDTRMKNVGLCEAIIKFSNTFSVDSPCEVLHTQKTRQLFYQPETNFWVVMTLSIPSQQKVKDGQTYIEYYAEEVQDHVFQALLKALYKMFRLFMGTFEHNIENGGSIEQLMQKLEIFYLRYLPTIKLHQVDLLDVFQGIQYLPLERHAYLKIQCFINLIEATFRQVKHTAFLYNDQLVWSGLDQEDIQILYRFLIFTLIPSFMESELQLGSLSPTRISSASGQHFGRFMTGPVVVNEEVTIGKIPRIYINVDCSSEYHLLVYRALSATVCLLVDASYQLTLDFFKRLDSFLGPQLSSLASEISEQYSKTVAVSSSTDQQTKCHYMYFNHLNLAEKSTIHIDARKTGHMSFPLEIIKLLADINYDLARMSDTGEIIGKTVGDCWVIGKLSDQREFYVILQQKNANIVNVSEEMKKLNSANFQNIFILD